MTKSTITESEAARYRDRALAAALGALELAILSTPSGEARNALCDANILVKQAVTILKENGHG